MLFIGLHMYIVLCCHSRNAQVEGKKSGARERYTPSSRSEKTTKMTRETMSSFSRNLREVASAILVASLIG